MEIIPKSGNILVNAKEIERKDSLISTYMVYEVVRETDNYKKGELLIFNPDKIILNTPQGAIFKENEVLAVVKDVEV